MAVDFLEKTNVVRFPRTDREEKNIEQAVEQAKDHFANSSVYIYHVAYLAPEYLKGVDFYVVIGRYCFVMQVVHQAAQARNLMVRGMEVIFIQEDFFPNQLTEKIIKKINYLINKL